MTLLCLTRPVSISWTHYSCVVVCEVCVIAGGIYKERYEKMVRELSFTKKRLQQQHDEELETEHASKKGVEKRVGY